MAGGGRSCAAAWLQVSVVASVSFVVSAGTVPFLPCNQGQCDSLPRRQGDTPCAVLLLGAWAGARCGDIYREHCLL